MDVAQELEVGRVVVTIRVILMEVNFLGETDQTEIEDVEVEVVTAAIVASVVDLLGEGKDAQEDTSTSDNNS